MHLPTIKQTRSGVLVHVRIFFAETHVTEVSTDVNETPQPSTTDDFGSNDIVTTETPGGPSTMENIG